MNTSGYNGEMKKSYHVGGRHRFCAYVNKFHENAIENKKTLKDVCKEMCDTALMTLAERAAENEVIKQTVKATVELIDIDDKAHRSEGIYKKIPFGAMCVIIAVAISLFLIVAGNVMVSQASMDLWSLENEYKELEEYKSELESKLLLKNDLRYIEYVARNELGMVDREHAKVAYIGDELQNKVVSFEYNDNISFSSLLSSLGFIK